MLIYEELRRIVGDDDDVLDVGTKDGRHLDGVAGDVYALDLGPDPRLPTVTYVRGDGCALPFNDGSFDYVVSNQVLEHVRDKDRILDEIHRVLRPDGTFLVSFPNRLFPGNPHDLPPFFSLLPRRVGQLASQLLDTERRAYYREHVFNLSPLLARKLLGSRFGQVEYVTASLVGRHRHIYADSQSGQLLMTLYPLIRLLTSTGPGVRAFELLFGYSAYRCSRPIHSI